MSETSTGHSNGDDHVPPFNDEEIEEMMQQAASDVMNKLVDGNDTRSHKNNNNINEHENNKDNKLNNKDDKSNNKGTEKMH